MNLLSDIDWQGLFELSIPLGEIIIRGTAMYWFLFIVFRFVIPRDVGKIGVADILILVIIADASQNAMAGEYGSITDGMILVAVLVSWSVIFDRLSFYSSAFRRFSTPRSICLVKNGVILKRNLRREYITEEELMEHMRLEGMESLEDVREVYVESNGGFSVIKSDSSK